MIISVYDINNNEFSSINVIGDDPFNLANAKIWIDPICQIPRYRLKDIKNKYKSKIVHKKETADYSVVSRNSTNSEHSCNPFYEVPKEDLEEYLMVDLDTTDIILIDKYSYDSSKTPLAKNDKSYIVNKYTQIIGSSKYILEENFIRVAFEDSLVIDREQYDKLVMMFQSTNQADWALAITIITNSNFVLSLGYIIVLLKTYENQIDACGIQKTYIPYKSLLNFVGHFSVHNLLELLDRKKALTQDIWNIVKPELEQRDLQNMRTTNYFHLKLSTPKPYLEQILKRHGISY